MPSPESPSYGPTNLPYLVFLASAAALGGFLFGFDSAVINGAVSGIEAGFHSSSVATGFAVASILLGCALGALMAGRFADVLGRRPTMVASAALFAVTAVASGLAPNEMVFIIARFLSGLGVGGASVVCPAYIAEISPERLRGRLASLQQLGIVLGIFVALLSDELLARAAGGASASLWAGLAAWRWMFLVEVLPAVAFGAAALSVSESPRYLVMRRREAEALRVLRRIQPEIPESYVARIRDTVQSDTRPRLADLRTASGGLLPIVWTGVGLSVLQQFVGINSIFYYGAVLWEAVGFTAADSLRINVVTGVVNILSTLVAIVLIDKIGRRPLLLWGSAAMALTLAMVVAAFASGTGRAGGHVSLSHGAGLVALVAANLYVFAFGVSWGPCVWVLLGEMFPNRIRAAALAVAVFAQWIANWIVTVSFPPTVATVGPAGAYGGYLLLAVLSFLFVSRWVRETRGVALENM